MLEEFKHTMYGGETINVAIIEDVSTIRTSYDMFLSKKENINVIISADSVETFFDQWDDQKLDLVLSDIGLPGKSGIEGISMIKEKSAETDIILITIFEDEERIFKALCAGASGYLLKSMPLPKLVEEINNYRSGGAAMTPIVAKKVMNYFAPKKQYKTVLTAKEKQVVLCIVDGLTYKEVASRLGISVNTVCTHVKKIFKKLHINTRSQIVAMSLKGEI